MAQLSTSAASPLTRLPACPALLPPARRKNPLPADAVLIDEASMLSLPLAAALIDALRPNCQLVLVGDVDQLPPVGECMLESGCSACPAVCCAWPATPAIAAAGGADEAAGQTDAGSPRCSRPLLRTCCRAGHGAAEPAGLPPRAGG